MLDLAKQRAARRAARLKKIRRPKPTLEQLQPGITEAILKQVEKDGHGRSDEPLQWITKSSEALAKELNRQGYKISFVTLLNILVEKGFTMQHNWSVTNAKNSFLNREARLEEINRTAKELICDNQIVLFITCKIDSGAKPSGPRASAAASEQDSNEMPVNSVDDVARDIDFVDFTSSFICYWYGQFGRKYFPSSTFAYFILDKVGIEPFADDRWSAEMQKFSLASGVTVESVLFPSVTYRWRRIAQKYEHRVNLGNNLGTASVCIYIIK